MKRATVADERGRSWVIYENDSAWDLCSILAKSGVSEVVLPSRTLLTGHLVDMEYQWFAATLEDSIKQFPDVATAVRRQVRLQDCVEYLRRRR